MEKLIELIRAFKSELSESTSTAPIQRQHCTNLLSLAESLAANYQTLKARVESVEKALKQTQTECLNIHSAVDGAFYDMLTQTQKMMNETTAVTAAETETNDAASQVSFDISSMEAPLTTLINMTTTINNSTTNAEVPPVTSTQNDEDDDDEDEDKSEATTSESISQNETVVAVKKYNETLIEMAISQKKAETSVIVLNDTINNNEIVADTNQVDQIVEEEEKEEEDEMMICDETLRNVDEMPVGSTPKKASRDDGDMAATTSSKTPTIIPFNNELTAATSDTSINSGESKKAAKSRKQPAPTRRRTSITNESIASETILECLAEESPAPNNEFDHSQFTRFDAKKMAAMLCKSCKVVLNRLSDEEIAAYTRKRISPKREKRSLSFDSHSSDSYNLDQLNAEDFVSSYINKERRLDEMDTEWTDTSSGKEATKKGAGKTRGKKGRKDSDSSFDPIEELDVLDEDEADDDAEADVYERDMPSISFETTQDDDYFSTKSGSHVEDATEEVTEETNESNESAFSFESIIKSSKRRKSMRIVSDSDSTICEDDDDDDDEDDEEEEESLNIPLPKMPRLESESSDGDDDEDVVSKKPKKNSSRLRSRVESSDSATTTTSTTTTSDTVPKVAHKYTTRLSYSMTNQKKRAKKIEASSNDDNSNQSVPAVRIKVKTENLSFDEKYACEDDEVIEIEPSQTKAEKKKKNGQDTRKKLRAIIQDSNLKQVTKNAYKSEKDRVERLRKLKERIERESVKDDTNIYLDYDFEKRVPLLKLDPHIVNVLKPHQTEGIKFMWDTCFESVDAISKDDPGSGCLLSHCMGLGKTLQVVALLHTVLTNAALTKCRRALIIVPKNVLSNWEIEFDKWTKKCAKHVHVYSFKKLDRDRDAEKSLARKRAEELSKWFTKGGVFILSYTLFTSLILNGGNRSIKMGKRFDEYLRDPGPDIVVCDEGHMIKSDMTNMTAAINTISTKRRIILTGTPLQNNLMEYYNMVQFIKPNLLGDKKEFQNRFANPINNGTMKDSTDVDVRIMKKRAHVLHNTLEYCVQRKDYSVIRELLPPKNEYVLSIKLTEKQIQLYTKYLEHRGIDIHNMTLAITGTQLFSDFHSLSCVWTHPYAIFLRAARSAKAKQRRMKSSTAAADASEVDEVDDVLEPTTAITKASMEEAAKYWRELITDECQADFTTSSKLIVFQSILNKCKAVGDKLVVFSQSLVSLDIIELFLKYLNDTGQSSWVKGQDYFRMDGSTETSTRDHQVETFNSVNKKKCRLFLISTKAGGIGINLVAANRCIIFDACFNPCHDTQSIFRIYRFGQTKEVFVYRFLAHGTMEEKIYQRQVNKQSLSQRVLDEHQLDRHFTRSELAEMYRFEPDKWTASPLDYPKDDLLKEVLSDLKNIILKMHEHDSLLENRIDEGLSAEEREAAWSEFELEKDRERERAEYMERIAEHSAHRLNEMAAHAAANANPDFTLSNGINMRVHPNTNINNHASTNHFDFRRSNPNFGSFAQNFPPPDQNQDSPFRMINEQFSAAFQPNNLFSTDHLRNLLLNNNAPKPNMMSYAPQTNGVAPKQPMMNNVNKPTQPSTSSSAAPQFRNYPQPQQQQRPQQQQWPQQQQPQQQQRPRLSTLPNNANSSSTNDANITNGKK